MAKNRNVLYRIYDAAGALLYVGATTNPGGRFETHALLQPWWDEASGIRLERFDTWEDLTEAEATAIRLERPKHNVIHTNHPMPWTRKPRVPRGDGCLYRRKDGVWIGRIELPPGPDGRRRGKTVSSKDHATALRRFEALKAEFRQLAS